MTFGLIDAEKANYPITVLCLVLGVSESGFHEWRSRPPSPRAIADAALLGTIREIHQMSRGTSMAAPGCGPSCASGRASECLANGWSA